MSATTKQNKQSTKEFEGGKKMRRYYYGEVADSENWEKRHRVIEVKANSVQEAYKIISEKKEPDEDIYQISRDFDDCKLAQPVYDFFNGFSLAGSKEATSKTWEDR